MASKKNVRVASAWSGAGFCAEVAMGKIVPRLVLPAILIVAGHCGAKDKALKINPHRPSAHLRREREGLVPRRGLELQSACDGGLLWSLGAD